MTADGLGEPSFGGATAEARVPPLREIRAQAFTPSPLCGPPKRYFMANKSQTPGDRIPLPSGLGDQQTSSCHMGTLLSLRTCRWRFEPASI